MTSPTSDGWKDDETRNKNKIKKKKMQKFNPNLLGFQCNGAPEAVNRAGEIESVADAVSSKGKK